MEVANLAFHLTAFLFALLAAWLLLFINQERKHSNRLLAFILIAFSFQHIMLILLFSKLILQAPWLLRIFGPSTFLIAPASYLYIRSILNDEWKFRKYDALLLIPAGLALINFIPYYFLTNQQKVDIIQHSFYANTRNPDSGRGFLPSPIYYSMRVLWSGLFIFLNFRQLFRFKAQSTPVLLDKNKALLHWLFSFNGLLTAILFAVMAKLLISPLKNSPVTISDMLLAVTVLFICLQLFFRPHILYGMFSPTTFTAIGISIKPDHLASPEVQVNVDDFSSYPEAESIPPDFPLSTEDHSLYKQMIESYFQESKPYLDPNFSLDQLVTYTRLPRYFVSAFINREYGLGFKEFLNRYRVEYFKDNVGLQEWNHLTLEGMATLCGFGSRSSFIRNFKQITGQTPTDFLKGNNSSSHVVPKTPCFLRLTF